MVEGGDEVVVGGDFGGYFGSLYGFLYMYVVDKKKEFDVIFCIGFGNF